MLGRRAIPAIRSSQRIRKRIEDAFGWIKTVAGQEEADRVLGCPGFGLAQERICFRRSDLRRLDLGGWRRSLFCRAGSLI